MAGHAVRLGSDGRLEVVRSAPPEDVARLRRTIDALRGAAGAGAVEIVERKDEGDAIELVLAFAGRSPTAPMSATELAPIAASLAANLADLHLRRLAHGAVRAEHVLIDAEGVVRLCGLGSGEDALSSDDVAAFGALVHALLDAQDRGTAADALRATADRCTVDDPLARPTMAAIAASLASAPRRTIEAVPRESRPPRRRWTIGVGALAIAIVGVATLAVRAAPRDVPTPALSTTTSSALTTTSVVPTRLWPRPASHTLHGAGATWELGERDDVVVVGDWDCDGVQTPALVRRDGAVFVIDAWPDGDEATARYVTSVPGARAATVRRDARCDVLVVATDAGDVMPSLAAA